MGLVPLEDETRELASSLSTTQPEGGHMQLERGPSPDIECAGPLILDFQPPEVGDKCLLFKSPCLWHFVTAARTD